jgi:glycerol kinase
MSQLHNHGPLIAALDQGTSSTRLSVYASDGTCVAMHQVPTVSIHPSAG